MRGLTDEERDYILLCDRGCDCGPAGIGAGYVDVNQCKPQTIAMCEKLKKRGLLAFSSCRRGFYCQHPYVTATGRLALRCDQLARSTFMP